MLNSLLSSFGRRVSREVGENVEFGAEGVLHPSEGGIAVGRGDELPAHVINLAESVGIVERRIGRRQVGAVIREVSSGGEG
jgi:hypothetical protein